jgi:hypothetical protein
MRRAPWNPTPAQERVALVLCDSSVGGQVRSLPDGIAELRTVEGGAFRRYLIDEDGTATLVESRPRSAAYGWSIALMWSGLLCVFVVPFSLILADNVGLVSEEPDDFWGAMVLLAGLVVFVVGMALHPHGGTPPGERWTLIGGAEE